MRPTFPTCRKRRRPPDTSKKAITQIQSTADKAPDVSVDALKNISLTASGAGQTTVALQAVDALRTIGKNAMSKNDNSVVGKVRESLAALAAQSKDPLIKTAANNGSLAMQSSIK